MTVRRHERIDAQHLPGGHWNADQKDTLGNVFGVPMFGQNPGDGSAAQPPAGMFEWGSEFVALLDHPMILPYLAATLDRALPPPPTARPLTGA